MTLWLTVIGGGFLAWLIVVLLFTPRVDYHLSEPLPLEQPDFLKVIQAICQVSVHGGNHVEVLTNGEQFYPAILQAVRHARVSINLECYIFKDGRIARELAEALAERARAGVQVRVVADAIGSFSLWGRTVGMMRDAGCRVCFYQPMTWYRLARLNNRTHRELLVVDGRVAFVGGAGIADWWIDPPKRNRPRWRDTMARIEGPVVRALQGVFAENWCECGGEILSGLHQFPELDPMGNVRAFVLKSSPADRATPSRLTFQMLIEGAQERLDLSTPYFLPDVSFRRALKDAARRGVHVRIIVPGQHTDQRLVRLASRRLYGELLEAGVRIWEYRPGMTHVKSLIVDRRWAVMGTTNVDNRSFEHNDELNVTMCDEELAARLTRDFQHDVADSDEVSLRRWSSRPVLEKVFGRCAWILERQQ